MKIVVPGLKIDMIDLSTDKVDAGCCDAQIAEPRSGGGYFDRVARCTNTGVLQW